MPTTERNRFSAKASRWMWSYGGWFPSHMEPSKTLGLLLDYKWLTNWSKHQCFHFCFSFGPSWTFPPASHQTRLHQPMPVNHWFCNFGGTSMNEYLIDISNDEFRHHITWNSTQPSTLQLIEHQNHETNRRNCHHPCHQRPIHVSATSPRWRRRWIFRSCWAPEWAWKVCPRLHSCISGPGKPPGVTGNDLAVGQLTINGGTMINKWWQ